MEELTSSFPLSIFIAELEGRKQLYSARLK
jgi:hypothetical protein